MSRTHARLARLATLALALAAGAACLLVSERPSIDSSWSFVTEAHAIIGRPLTPMSYAGVARRTTYRAAAYGAAAYGAAAYGAAHVYAAPVVVAPVCVQRVDVYGRVYTVCP